MKDELVRFNPWWEGELNILPTNFISRTIFETGKLCLSDSFISVFHGISHAGKSTMLLFLINELLTKLYIQPKRILLLDCKNKDSILDTLTTIIENNSPYKTFIFLDNVDYLNDFSVISKIIHKHESLVKLCLTATQNITLDLPIEKISYHEIPPFSFKEILEKKWQEFNQKKFKFEDLEKIYINHNLEETFDNYLLFGGLPEVQTTQNKIEKINHLKQIIATAIKNEDEEIYKYLAIKSGNLLNLSELAVESGISRYKAEKNLLEIEKYKMINLLPSLEIDINKSLVKSYKIFFHDIGIRNSLLNSFNPLNERIDNEALYQNFIALEIYYALKKQEMYFFRTTNQTEINFVIEGVNELIPIQIQISGTQKNIPRIFTSFYRKSKQKISKMIVITKNYLHKDNFSKADVYFIPAPLFSLFDWNR